MAPDWSADYLHCESTGDTIVALGILAPGWFMLRLKAGWSIAPGPDAVARELPREAAAARSQDVARASHPVPPSAPYPTPEFAMSASPTRISEVIDVRAAGQSSPGAPLSQLARAETLEVRRLTLTTGRDIPTHHARGGIVVHCLEGRCAFTAAGTTRERGAGQRIVLATGEPHSVAGLEDSVVLVTKVHPVDRPAP